MFISVPRLWLKFQQGVFAKMPPAKLDRLLKIPILGGIVRKKVLTALGLQECVFAAGGAAPMPPDLLRWYNKLGLDLVEVYGMTENCGVSHATLPGKQRPGTVGLPYEGVQSRIDPANGEIQMKSPGLMLGYYKEPELTRESFTPDGWLHTGDKGRLESDGYLRITGRVKDLFKTSKGKYVAPAPIEDRLGMHVDIEACCVTGANLAQPLGIAMLSPQGLQQAGAVAAEDAVGIRQADPDPYRRSSWGCDPGTCPLAGSDHLRRLQTAHAEAAPSLGTDAAVATTILHASLPPLWLRWCCIRSFPPYTHPFADRVRASAAPASCTQSRGP